MQTNFVPDFVPDKLQVSNISITEDGILQANFNKKFLSPIIAVNTDDSSNGEKSRRLEQTSSPDSGKFDIMEVVSIDVRDTGEDEDFLSIKGIDSFSLEKIEDQSLHI